MGRNFGGAQGPNAAAQQRATPCPRWQNSLRPDSLPRQGGDHEALLTRRAFPARVARRHRCRGARRLDRPARRADLSLAHHQDGGALPGRRHHRRAAAHDAGAADPQVGPADRGREQAGCGRQPRRRAGLQRRPRRLHADGDGALAAHRQPEPLCQAGVRPGGVRAGDDHGDDPDRAVRQPEQDQGQHGR